MITSDLKSLLKQFNKQELGLLEKEHRLSSGLDKSKITDAARVYDFSLPSRTGPTPLGNSDATRCFQGVAGLASYTLIDAENSISLRSNGNTISPQGRVAVGAVLDTDQNASALPGADDLGGLPVVLVAGINYGTQCHPSHSDRDYFKQPPELHENLDLRGWLENTVEGLIACQHKVERLKNTFYHVVTANFFPWITAVPWSECASSVLREELLLRYFGWPNPLDFVARLIREIQTKCQPLPQERGLTHVFFHGAQTSAMRCGLALTAQLTRDYSPTLQKLPLYRAYHETPPVPPLSDFLHRDRKIRRGPDVIFCEDHAAFRNGNILTPTQGGSIVQDAIWLWQDKSCGDEDEVMGLGE